MRPDFKKILTERPRRGSGSGFKDVRRAHQDHITDDDVGFKESMRRPYRRGRKEFSDLLGPLHRFLNAQVGRSWDEVYSEIAVHTKGGSMIQQHLLQHVFRYVERRIWVGTDNRLYGKRGELLDGWFRKEFYVHPIDGTLRAAPVRKRFTNRWVDPNTPEEMKLADGRLFRMLKGIWYEITITTYESFAWIRQHVPGNDNREPIMVPTIQKVENKRQLNSKELKVLHLRNAA